MRKKTLLTVLTFVTFLQISFARQTEEKVLIAVLPFIGSSTAQSNYVSAIQEYVSKEFIGKSRFEIVDRSKFTSVLKELNIQKSEEFLNSKIVEQGRLSGAQYLVTGIVSDAGMKSVVQEKLTTYGGKPTGGTHTEIEYQGTISFSFQVIEVATSKAIYQENINAKSGTSALSGEGNAMQTALCKIKKPIKTALLKLFPPEISIIQIESKTKKGLPEKVLISAGNSFFDEEKTKDCVFEIDEKITNLFKKTGIFLKVYEVEVMNVNGKEIKREKEVGKLKLDEVQGDVSICKVDDGAKEIMERMAGGKKLYLKIF